MNQIDIGTMLSTLRSATSDAHAALDGSFGALDMNERAGYTRFLRAHAIGLAPLFDLYQDFVTRELAMPCPDYLAMLHADLDELGENPSRLPALAVPRDLSAAGVAYVVSGSRLGLTMIRRNGYWGERNGHPSRYMEDESGILVWKSLSTWMKRHPASPDEEQSASQSALVAFDTFGSAYAASSLARAH